MLFSLLTFSSFCKSSAGPEIHPVLAKSVFAVMWEFILLCIYPNIGLLVSHLLCEDPVRQQVGTNLHIWGKNAKSSVTRLNWQSLWSTRLVRYQQGRWGWAGDADSASDWSNSRCVNWVRHWGGERRRRSRGRGRRRRWHRWQNGPNKYRMRVKTGAVSGVKIINTIKSATIKRVYSQRSNEQEQNIGQGT